MTPSILYINNFLQQLSAKEIAELKAMLEKKAGKE
jgi:hypothetical protein